MGNTYRIYIRSNEHPRTINTPQNGRTNYTLVCAVGKAEFIKTLNALLNKGAIITEVRYGWGGASVNWYQYAY